MKLLIFLADSLKRLREFPDKVQSDAGYELFNVQCGKQPADFKPFPTIGPGVEELRIRDQSGAFRVFYVARFADAVYVLHCFQKKTQKTERSDIELARDRYDALVRELDQTDRRKGEKQ